MTKPEKLCPASKHVVQSRIFGARPGPLNLVYEVVDVKVNSPDLEEEARFPMNLVVSSCTAVSEDGETFVFKQPGGFLEAGGVDGVCSTPAPCEVGHTYAAAMTAQPDGLWILTSDEVADISFLSNPGECDTVAAFEVAE